MPCSARPTVERLSARRPHAALVEAIQHNGKANGDGGARSRREALAAAIAKRDEEKRELSATDRAIAECMRRINEAKRAVDAAGKRIEEAKPATAADLIIKEMVGVEPSPLNPSIAEARAARQQAQDDLDAAMEAHAVLTKGRSGSAVSFSTDAVEKAIGEVVMPAFVELLNFYRAEQDRLAYIKAQLGVLSDVTLNVRGPEYRHWASLILDDPKVDTSALKAAVAGLKSNPDTDIAGIVETVKAGQKLPHAELPPDDKPRWPPPGVNKYGGRLT